MVRLPIVADDDYEWGDILNEFLAIGHTPDGKIKNPYGDFCRVGFWMDGRTAVPVGATTINRSLTANRILAIPVWLGESINIDAVSLDVGVAAATALVTVQYGTVDENGTLTITNSFASIDASTTGAKTSSFTAQAVPGGPGFLLVGTGTAGVSIVAYSDLHSGIFFLGAGSLSFSMINYDAGHFPFVGPYTGFPSGATSGSMLTVAMRRAA